jgi:prolyl 4-hydroxylase
MATKAIKRTRGHKNGSNGEMGVLSKSIRPFVVDRFLEEQECSEIRKELVFSLWRPSMVREKQEDGAYRDVLSRPVRVSDTAVQQWFSDDVKGALKKIEKRLQQFIPFDPVCLEPWQATNYGSDGFLSYHLDSGYWEDHPAGDRVITFLIYLTTPLKGGGTHFRALDLHIDAVAGRLVIWKNLFPDGRPDHRMLHSGFPLVKGEKIILVTWVRQKPHFWKTADTKPKRKVNDYGK